MLRKILETTDWKYVWLVFDDTKRFESPDGIVFHPEKIQDLWDGYVRYSNAHYVVLTKLIK